MRAVFLKVHVTCFENLGPRSFVVRFVPIDSPVLLSPEERRGKEVGVWGRDLGTLVPPQAPLSGTAFPLQPRRVINRFAPEQLVRDHQQPPWPRPPSLSSCRACWPPG